MGASEGVGGEKGRASEEAGAARDKAQEPGMTGGGQSPEDLMKESIVSGGQWGRSGTAPRP